ncbi:MAG: Bcr/CflA family efflux MFS transporter [Rickettsiaceae bacterium]|nr:Bcr/CflA family efflux MFS transporter [Rickettsiaceae bacterium]
MKLGPIPPILLYSLCCISVLTETICTVAFPRITHSMSVSGSLIQLSTTAYYFGFSLGIFTLGRLSDLYGRRIIVLLGLSFYILATLAASQSTNIQSFIFCRFLQAYGASIGSVIAQAMARDSYQDSRLSQIYLNTSIITSLAPTAGSLFGGYIIDYYNSWQSILISLSAIGCIALIVYYFFLPETNRYIGADKGNNFYGVLKSTYKDKIFVGYGITVGILNGCYVGFFVQAPFVFIEKYQIATTTYGALFAVLSCATLLGSLIAKYMIKKYVPILKVQIAGLISIVIGCLLLIIVSLTDFVMQNVIYAIIAIFGCMSMLYAGYGMIIPTILSTCLDNYRKVLGSAGSILGATYYIITSMITLLISYLHSETITNYALMCGFLLLIALPAFISSKIAEMKEKESVISL